MKRNYSKIGAILLSMVVTFSAVFYSVPRMQEVVAKAALQGTLLTDEDINSLIDTTTYQRVSVHDPSIVLDKMGSYYIFGSHMGVGKTNDLMNFSSVTSESTTSPLFGNSSKEIVSYEEAFVSNAYTQTVTVKDKNGTTYLADFGNYNAADWISNNTITGNMWAPDVIYNETMNQWCMYLSLNGAKWNSVILLLTSDSIEGPYVYQGPVVFSGFSTASSSKSYKKTDLELVIGEMEELPQKYQKIADNTWGSYFPHAIDPCVYFDDNGNLYLAYGSWSGGIYVLELDESTGLRDYTVTYEDTYDSLSKNMTSDPYFGIKIAGGHYVSGEGPYIQKIGDYYFLFLSYGFYSPDGGYNMRIFRSKQPQGPYTDLNGKSAIFSSYEMNYSAVNANYNRGLKLLGNYKWDTMKKAEIAQGHNSAFVDNDGKAYVIYHTKFNDGSAGHEVRVHQLFLNEDGWLVAAPYEYSLETISKNGYKTSELVGNYQVIAHTFQMDYENLDYVSPVDITLHSDGTITGAYSGTWSQKANTPYATLILNGTEYKGVFTEQVVDGTGVKTMCFTIVNQAGLCIWGSKEFTDKEAVAQTVKSMNHSIPETTYSNLSLPMSGCNGTTITYQSSNEAILSSNGIITRPAQDTTVQLTQIISKGQYYYQKTYPITVKAAQQNQTDRLLLGSYFNNTPIDLSNYLDGSLSVANPFYQYTNYGLDLSGGITVEFDIETTGDIRVLAAILSFMGEKGENGRLYFTHGSYLGYNADGSYFDANIKNFGLVTDYIGISSHVALSFTTTGFSVLINGTTVYTEEIVTTENGSASIQNYQSVLEWLQNKADTLYFGYGSFWTSQGYDEANCKISNVACYAEPIPASNQPIITLFKEDYTLAAAEDITYEANPFYGANLNAVTIQYTINFAEAAAKNGWDGIFSFYNSKTGGRISIQSAPYICYNDGNGNWIDINHPDSSGTNAAAGAVKNKDYTITISITSSDVKIMADDTEIAISKNSSGAAYQDLLTFLTECDQITYGVGKGVTSYWWTELCTIKDLSIIGANVKKENTILPDTQLTSSSITYYNNPYYNTDLKAVYIDYTINFAETAAKNGWDGIFSFYNSKTGGRISIQSAPYICYNDGNGNWIDINRPDTEKGSNLAAEASANTNHTIRLSITEQTAKIQWNKTEIPIEISTSGASYSDLLKFISACDKITIGVGEAATSYWWTEACNLSNLSFHGFVEK